MTVNITGDEYERVLQEDSGSEFWRPHSAGIKPITFVRQVRQVVDCCLNKWYIERNVKGSLTELQKSTECDLLLVLWNNSEQNRREWFISVRLYNEHSVFSSVFCQYVTPQQTQNVLLMLVFIFFFWEILTLGKHFFIFIFVTIK